MDRYPRYFREEEWGPLEIDPKQLEKIIAEIISTDFKLTFQRLERPFLESNDLIAHCTDKLNRNIKSLVRVRSYTIPLDEDDVGDLYEDMLQMKAECCIFITNSHFTEGAKKFAEPLPTRLVDGIKLGELLPMPVGQLIEFAFLSDFNDEDIVMHAQRREKKKFFGLLGADEKIEEIDRRYMPLGHFSIREKAGGSDRITEFYVDLHKGNVLYMEQERIMEDDFLKRILDLPEESRKYLFDLLDYGELHHKNIEGKSLSILEKRGLAVVYEREKGKGILSMVTEDITSTISTTTKEFTTVKKTEPTFSGREKLEIDKYARATVIKPVIEMPFDLRHFIESSPNADPEFDMDEIKYPQENVLEALKKLYTAKDISFIGIACLPYYKCKYVSKSGMVRFEDAVTPQFKPFIPQPTENTWVYRIVDKYPSVPYIIIAVGYLLINLIRLEKVIHVFSSAFIFLTIAVIVGVILKVIFRTERKIPRYHGTIIRYGFPSIHSIASVGAIAFIYFVDPLLALLLMPLGALYIYSRLKLGVHSETDIIGGAIVGTIVGILCGIYILPINPGITVELILAVLFFIGPILLTIIEWKTRQY